MWIENVIEFEIRSNFFCFFVFSCFAHRKNNSEYILLHCFTHKESMLVVFFSSFVCYFNRDKLQNGTKAILVNRLVFFLCCWNRSSYFSWLLRLLTNQTNSIIFIFGIKIDDKCKRIEIQWWENIYISFICLLHLGLLFFIFSINEKEREKNESENIS